MNDISAIRKDYKLKALQESDADPDPVIQFRHWWTEAVNSSIEEVNAMTLATADENGRPSARIVLLKGFDENGFTFFTNYNSRKAANISDKPYAALVFFWKELERQVRIEGTVSKVTAEQSDAYFRSRPHGSKIGAWASPQSSTISGREIIEQKVMELEKDFQGKDISCPPFWGGYALQPELMEFWQGRPNRLHDRLQYLKQESSWKISRLAP
jgi:pyridoxamine 5'-phosphate oxidase